MVSNETGSPAPDTAIAGERPRPVVEGWRALAGQYVNMLFVDHGFIRYVYSNFHPISDKMYRSAQPVPMHIDEAARRGIRTIVNLRGRRDNCGSWVLEDRACRRLGIALVDFPVNSRDAPRKEVLHRARDLWNRIEYPALMHCKAGADRVGFMSVLYRHVHEGVPMREALSQLSLRYGHVRQAKTGILDYFYESYLAHDRQTPTDFYAWVDNVYDRDRLKEAFRSSKVADVVTDKILDRE